MPQLSEQAKRLIEDFERKIEAIPANERDAVLERMTSHILALNEDVKGLFAILQKDTKEVEDVPSEKNISNLRDYI